MTLLPQPKVSNRWALYRLVLADFLLTATLFVAANVLEINSGFTLPPDLAGQWIGAIANQHIHVCAGYALIFGVLITLLGYTEGLYEPMDDSVQQNMLATFRVVCWATVLTGCAVLLDKSQTTSLTELVFAGILSSVGLIGWRRWWLLATLRKACKGKGARNVLIVGRGRLGLQLADYFDKHPQTRCVVKGFLDDRGYSSPDVLGRFEDLSTVARAAFIDEVILSAPYDREQARRIIQTARLNRLDLRIAPELFGSSLHSLTVERAGGVPLISLANEAIPVLGLLLKRALDILLSAGALLFFAPCMGIIAAVVKLDSSGPAVYSALRVGKKGQRFRCYKFRTMAVNADMLKDTLRVCNQRHGPCFKIDRDPRITRVGHFLRRYSLDELPQL